jgi:hypothetical protein
MTVGEVLTVVLDGETEKDGELKEVSVAGLGMELAVTFGPDD